MAVDVKGALSVLGSVYTLTARTVRRNVTIIVPLMFIGLFESLGLILVYMSPRRPFVSLLGPIIRQMADGHGEQFLHYPNNFLVLEKLQYYGYIAMMVLVGHMLLGAMCRMMANAYDEGPTALGGSLLLGVRYWLSTVVAWGLPFAVNWFSLKGLTSYGMSLFAHGEQTVAGMTPEAWSFLLKSIYVVWAVVIDFFTVYTIPAVVTEHRRVWPAFGRSIQVMRSAKLVTLVLVAVPTIVQLLYIALRGWMRARWYATFPDITVHIVAIAVFVRFVSEMLLRLPATTMLLLVRDSEGGAE